ncbi:MAG: hypothetical protein V2J20_03885 [Wenzhouxiangella sp.]|jgi:hypothetical protein|nr:hypothetical protein [Wenzhouxiangella sp.]
MKNQITTPAAGHDARSSILQVVVWCFSVPILASWTLISLLPAISVLRAWGDFLDVMIAVGFFASGACGLIAAAVAYRWLLAGRSTSAASGQDRTFRIVGLTAYALVWMAIYAIW